MQTIRCGAQRPPGFIARPATSAQCNSSTFVDTPGELDFCFILPVFQIGVDGFEIANDDGDLPSFWDRRGESSTSSYNRINRIVSLSACILYVRPNARAD
jgi:hypothetical protein